MGSSSRLLWQQISTASQKLGGTAAGALYGGHPSTSGGQYSAGTVNVNGGHGMDEQGLKLMLEETLPGALVSPIEKLASTIGAA